MLVYFHNKVDQSYIIRWNYNRDNVNFTKTNPHISFADVTLNTNMHSFKKFEAVVCIPTITPPQPTLRLQTTYWQPLFCLTGCF